MAAAEERIVFADFLPTVGLAHEFDSVTSSAGFVGVKDGRRLVQLPVRGLGPGAQDFQVIDLELRQTVFQFGKRLARHDQASCGGTSPSSRPSGPGSRSRST